MKPYTWKEAFEDALEAAKRGKPEYQTFVGYCFDIGKGVKCDPKMAKYWYTKAARNGNSDAIFNLALSYDHGSLGLRKNRRRAVQLYRQAALKGHLQSQTNLAAILLEGNGKKDSAEGARWMRKAAQRGDDLAQYNLGRSYAYGEDGLQKNAALAKKWLSKAQKQGHLKARRLLNSKYLKEASRT